MMTSSNGTIFRVTGPLWGESAGHRWFPLTKVSDAELCARTNGWANNRHAGDLTRHRAHYDVSVILRSMIFPKWFTFWIPSLCSPQLSCGDICQIWQWLKESYKYFCKIENFHNEEILKRSFNNPHLRSPPLIRPNYRKISNIRRTKSPNLNVSRLVLLLSLPNPTKPGVKSRMKI